MAIKKVGNIWVACLHAVLYTLPFVLLTQGMMALAVICLTHMVIDRFRLARYWVDFWGIGKAGWLPPKLGMNLAKPSAPGDLTATTPASSTDAPPFLGVWLLIIADNTLHLAINYVALRWL
jgi:hypothetical protein